MRDWTKEVRDRLAREGGRTLPNDVVEEIAQHVADLHRAALFDGRAVEDADRLAEEELTNIDVVAESIQRRRRGPMSAVVEGDPGFWAGTVRDVVHAIRLIGVRRGHSAVVILTLAVGIGACTAVFSLFNALLLGPLPYPDPDRLVLVWETDADDPSRTFIVAAPNYHDWVTATHSFAALGVWEYLTFNVSAVAEPEQVQGLRASSSLFRTLGVTPAMGRTFTAEEDAGHRVAVISDAVWKAHFGSDPRVVGKSIRLNGHVHEVIGVMPHGFEFPRTGTGIWTPLALTEQDQERGSHSFYVAGRLAEGVTFEQARDEVERLGARLRERYTENTGEGATIQRMDEFGVINTRRILVALSGAVALVLLIACVNVASLQLALGLSRTREFMTRLALGARYRQLARQVLLESLVVGIVGCAAGLAIAAAITRAVDLILAPGFRSLPFRGEVAVALDIRVLLFAAITSALAALLFGFVPLVGLGRRSFQSALREGGRASMRLAAGTRRALVAIEIALAIMVLCGAGLMIRSLATLLDVSPGLDARTLLLMQVSLPQTDTYGPSERTEFCDDLSREVGSLPGVMRASAISHLPLSNASAGRGLTIEGRPEPPPNEGASAAYRLICPDYFATLGIPVIAGREFNVRDSRDSEPVVIVNRVFVERYWPQGDAKLGNVRSSNPWLTIVGITDNVRHFGLEAAPVREIFRPYSQAAWPVMTVVAKTAGEPMLWQRPVREALHRVEAGLPAANVRSMEDVVNASVAWRATPMRLLTGFAVIGLLLAGVGVYGVLAYYVSQRTRELGVRVALGASKATLITLVLRQSALPLAAGVALGIAGSQAAGTVLTGLLYEVRPGDPLVLTTIVVLLIVVSLISSWLPARRAAMVDPLVALRDE